MGWNPKLGATGAHRAARGGFAALLVVLGWSLVIAMVFVGGYRLAYHDAGNALVELQQAKTDRRELRAALTDAEERIARFERSESINREAQRLVQAQLEDLQQERHDCAKQVLALERLIREGGGGPVSREPIQRPSAPPDAGAFSGPEPDDPAS